MNITETVRAQIQDVFRGNNSAVLTVVAPVPNEIRRSYRTATHIVKAVSKENGRSDCWNKGQISYWVVSNEHAFPATTFHCTCCGGWSVPLIVQDPACPHLLAAESRCVFPLAIILQALWAGIYLLGALGYLNSFVVLNRSIGFDVAFPNEDIHALTEEYNPLIRVSIDQKLISEFFAVGIDACVLSILCIVGAYFGINVNVRGYFLLTSTALQIVPTTVLFVLSVIMCVSNRTIHSNDLWFQKTMPPSEFCGSCVDEMEEFD